MKNYSLSSLLLIPILFANTLFAESHKIIKPPIQLKNAANAYKKSGANAFLPTLFHKQMASGNQQNMLSKTNILREVEKVYGNFVGLEMVDNIRVSNSTNIIFFILKYQQGPLYGVITTYQLKRSKRITGFKIHTEISQIIPTQILAKYKHVGSDQDK